MQKLMIYGSRRSRKKNANMRHPLSNIFMACLVFSPLIVSDQELAGQSDSAKTVPSVFSYRAYSESEIEAAMRRPLTLEDCIRIALKKNISLRLAEGDLAKADASHSGSYGQFLPLFTLEGAKLNEQDETDTTRNATAISPSGLAETNTGNQTTLIGSVQLYIPTGATLQYSYDFLRDVQSPLGELAEKSDARSYSVSLTQPLLRGAGLTVARNPVLSAGYDRHIQEKQLLNTKLQTVFAVKRAYYEVLSSRELMKVNEAAVHSDSALMLASEALIVAKLAARRDVLSAKIRLADDRAAFIKSQNDYQLALDVLKDAMGVPIDLPVDLRESGLEYVPAVIDEQALVRGALENNPTIQSSEIGIKLSQLQHRVAKNELLPQLDLIASYSSNLRRDLVLNRDVSRTGGWQASLNLSYSFLSLDASAKAENARIGISQQRDRLLDQQRQIVLGVRDIVRSVYTAAEEINAIKQSIEAAEEKLAVANAMFSLGRASNFDITDAQEFLLKAKTQYFRSLVEYYTQLAFLESLAGQPIAP